MRANLRRARPAVAVALLAVVVWRVGSGPFLYGVRALDGRALVAAAVVFLITTVCYAWRWQVVADGLGVRLSLTDAVARYYRCLFLNLTLPGGVAGDVHRGVSHGRDARNVGSALRAVVWERMAGQAIQLLLAICALFILPSPVRSSMPFVALAVAATVAVVAVVLRARPGRGRSRWERTRQAVVTDIRHGLLRRRALLVVVLTSIVAVVGHVLTFLIAARAVGIAPISQLLPLAFLSMMAMGLPNIAGWGPREGVMAWAFSAAGLGAGRGAAVAVAYGIVVLAASLPGGVVLLLGRGPERRRLRTGALVNVWPRQPPHPSTNAMEPSG